MPRRAARRRMWPASAIADGERPSSYGGSTPASKTPRRNPTPSSAWSTRAGSRTCIPRSASCRSMFPAPVSVRSPERHDRPVRADSGPEPARCADLRKSEVRFRFANHVDSQRVRASAGSPRGQIAPYRLSGLVTPRPAAGREERPSSASWWDCTAVHRSRRSRNPQSRHPGPRVVRPRPPAAPRHR